MQEWFIDVTRLQQNDGADVTALVRELVGAYHSFPEKHRPHTIVVNTVTPIGLLFYSRLREENLPISAGDITLANTYESSLLRERVFGGRDSPVGR